MEIFMQDPVITRGSERLLTEVELELMTVIWSLGQATVKEVVSHLAKERALAYTTVATVMKILEQKGFLFCHKHSYAHLFSPLVSKVAYEGTCIEHMVAHVFDGEPVALVQRLLDAQPLAQADIHAIEEALRQLAEREGRPK